MKLESISIDNILAARDKYIDHFIKHKENFLVDFLDELQKNSPLFQYLSIILDSISTVKLNREMSCIIGILAMYLLMESIIEQQFQKFIQSSLN